MRQGSKGEISYDEDKNVITISNIIFTAVQLKYDKRKNIYSIIPLKHKKSAEARGVGIERVPWTSKLAEDLKKYWLWCLLTAAGMALAYWLISVTGG